MHRIHSAFAVLAVQGVLALAPCAVRAQPASAPLPVDVLVPTVTTLARADQQYALYLPPGYDPARRWPVLVVLDARGRGAMTAGLAMPGAKKRGWIVVSSHQSQSDTDETGTLLALQSLLREVGQRYAYDPRRVYLAGFSGTAKTLWTRVSPLQDLVAGVIGNGGGRPPELGPLRQAPAAFFGMAGTSDFNYQEMRELDAGLAALGATRRFEAFEGGHQWPDSTVLAGALDWFDLVAMQQGRTPRDEAWIDIRFGAARAHANAAPDALERWRRLDQLVRDFDGLRDVASLRTEAEGLRGSDAVKSLLAREERLRDDEHQAARRLDHWISRIAQRVVDGRETEPPSATAALRELRVPQLRRMAGNPDPALAASAQRRLERILVATSFYFPTRFARLGDERRAVAMLEIALAVAPERAAPHWQMARLHAGSGRVDEAFEALAEALRHGVADIEDLRADPLWAPLRGDPRWRDAVAPD